MAAAAPGADGVVLSLAGVDLVRDGRTILRDINWQVRRGERWALLGPNGSGKTSLLRLMHGIGRLSRGRMARACPTEEARRRQAFVFQTPIIMRRSVRDNLPFPLRLRGRALRDAHRTAERMAVSVGLENTLERQARNLSGGERQKLALARALICDPAVLFLDEPCAALDGRATREIEDILQEETGAGKRLIMTTHNLGQARRLAHDMVFLLRGRVHEHRSAEEFFETPGTPECAAFLRGDIVE